MNTKKMPETENKIKKSKKINISLFYLASRSPLLFLVHYGLAFFSAYGQTQLIFGFLGDALKKGGAETLKANAGGFLFRLLIYGVSVYLHILVGRYLEEFYTAHLRKKLTKKFLSANFTQTQKEEFILSRFDNDAATVGRLAVDIFNRSFYCVCSIILLLWGLGQTTDEKWVIPWCLGALAILAILVPILYYISYRYKLKRDREFDRENKRFKELRDNIEYIKTTGAENKEIEKSNRQFSKNLRKNYAFVATKSIYATVPSYILVRFIPFIFLVMSGAINGAVLYVKLNEMFGNCKTIFELFWAYGGYESYSSSRKRLNETFANLEKNQVSSPALNHLPTKKVDINFQNVTFAYSETNQKILDNFSFSFQKGKKYAITGPNGIGKSTLFKLMVKLYQPQQGTIKLDNTDLAKIDNSVLQKKTVYLPNSPAFFNTSLGNNIVYPDVYRENLHQTKLETVAKKLGVGEFVDKLPNRWEFIVAEKGQNLSEGQKQIVSLMRALVKDYENLLFDEFLSNISSDLKKKILKVIFSELKNRTIIFISHDEETLSYADEIYKFTPRKLEKANEKKK